MHTYTHKHNSTYPRLRDGWFLFTIHPIAYEYMHAHPLASLGVSPSPPPCSWIFLPTFLPFVRFHTQTYVRTYVRTYEHTNIQTYLRIYIHTNMQAYEHARILYTRVSNEHVYTRTQPNTCTGRPPSQPTSVNRCPSPLMYRRLLARVQQTSRPITSRCTMCLRTKRWSGVQTVVAPSLQVHVFKHTCNTGHRCREKYPVYGL